MSHPKEVECAECGETFPLNPAMLRTLEVLARDFPDVEPAGFLCAPCSDDPGDGWAALDTSDQEPYPAELADDERYPGRGFDA